jgi:hypothetical protein
MSKRSYGGRLTPLVVGLVVGLGLLSGCGPQLGPALPDLVTGYYQALSIASEDAAGETDASGVWSSDMQVGYSPESYARLYASPVPIRVIDDRIEIPEPMLDEWATAASPSWKMRPLTWDTASYEADVAFQLSFCDAYHHTWTAVALDDETIHVTRDGTGCGDGDGDSRIEDNRLEIEYVRVEACEGACEIVDDGEGAGDVLGWESRCAC